MNKDELQQKFPHVWRALVSLSTDNGTMKWLDPNLEEPFTPTDQDIEDWWRGPGEVPRTISYGTLDAQGATLDEEEMDILCGGEYEEVLTILEEKGIHEIDFWLNTVFQGSLHDKVWDR